MKIGPIDFTLFRNSAAEMRESVRKVRADLAAATEERKSIATAPIPRGELADLLCDWIAQRASAYPNNLANILRDCQSATAVANSKPFVIGATGGGLVGYGAVGREEIQSSLFYLLGDQIQKSVRKAIDAMDYPKEGLPRDARKAALDRLDARIAELSQQEKEIEAAIAEIRSGF